MAGVRHIVALRGDPIGGIGERYAPHPGGYHNGADLVAGIKRLSDVEVSVSAYPEKHPIASALFSTAIALPPSYYVEGASSVRGRPSQAACVTRHPAYHLRRATTAIIRQEISAVNSTSNEIFKYRQDFCGNGIHAPN